MYEFIIVVSEITAGERNMSQTYNRAFGYADHMDLVAPSLSSLKQMISICEEFANCHSIVSMFQKQSCCVLT